MSCVHHWRLDEPNGEPFVAAVCKRCGMTRSYRAADDDYYYGQFQKENAKRHRRKQEESL